MYESAETSKTKLSIKTINSTIKETVTYIILCIIFVISIHSLLIFHTNTRDARGVKFTESIV